MPRFDSSNSSCRVYVRRSGVLSAVGHDLEIAVTRYRLDIEWSPSPRVEAEFAADSLRVTSAVDGRVPRPGALSARDRATIDRHIADDVLAAARHPAIVFRSTAVEPRGSGFQVRGRLGLHGVERDVAFAVERTGDRWSAEVALNQPDFGIKPFRAFAGALKIEAQVQVRVELHWAPEA